MEQQYIKVTVACQSTIANLLQNSGGWPKGIQDKSPNKLTYVDRKPAVAWHISHATKEQAIAATRAFNQLKSKLKDDRGSVHMYATVAVYLDYLEDTESTPLLQKHEEFIYTHCSGTYPGAQAAVSSRNMQDIYEYTSYLQIGLAHILKYISECTLFLDKPTWLTLKLMGVLSVEKERWLSDVPVIYLDYGADMVMQTTAWQQLRQIVLPALLDLPAGGYKLYFRAPQENIVWSIGELTDYPVQVQRTLYHLGQPSQCQLPEVRHTHLESLLAQVGDCYDLPF